jgi:hypothetical protein
VRIKDKYRLYIMEGRIRMGCFMLHSKHPHLSPEFGPTIQNAWFSGFLSLCRKRLG